MQMHFLTADSFDSFSTVVLPRRRCLAVDRIEEPLRLFDTFDETYGCSNFACSPQLLQYLALGINLLALLTQNMDSLDAQPMLATN